MAARIVIWRLSLRGEKLSLQGETED